MAKNQLNKLFFLISVLLFGGTAAFPVSQPDRLVADGAIVAFHREWRNPVTPKGREHAEFGTRVDLWIVRIDHWATEKLESKYLLVEYWLYERAVSNREIQSAHLRFQLRKLRPDENKTCNLAGSGPMRLDDFQRTRPGRLDSIPSLEDLPCLVVDKPPTVLKAD